MFPSCIWYQNIWTGPGGHLVVHISASADLLCLTWSWILISLSHLNTLNLCLVSSADGGQKMEFHPGFQTVHSLSVRSDPTSDSTKFSGEHLDQKNISCPLFLLWLRMLWLSWAQWTVPVERWWCLCCGPAAVSFTSITEHLQSAVRRYTMTLIPGQHHTWTPGKMNTRTCSDVMTDDWLHFGPQPSFGDSEKLVEHKHKEQTTEAESFPTQRHTNMFSGFGALKTQLGLCVDQISGNSRTCSVLLW